MAIRPTYVPTFVLLGGTTARTRSPVRKPPTTLVALGALSGKPAALVRHICRLCRPSALISSGTMRWILSPCLLSGVTPEVVFHDCGITSPWYHTTQLT